MRDLRDDSNGVTRLVKRYYNEEGNECLVYKTVVPKNLESRTKTGATYRSYENEFGEHVLEEVKPRPKETRPKEVISVTYGKDGKPIHTVVR